MPGASKIGDIGQGECCCDHNGCIGMTGVLITGSGTVITNGAGQARITDIVLGDCGHTGVMVTSSGTVFSDSLGACRIGDVFSGCFTGNLVTGSGNVIIGG